MPLKGKVLNLPGFFIKEIHGFKPVHVHAKYSGKTLCPHCNGTKLRNKGKFIRKLKHESFGRRSCILHLESCKYLCQSCGKYFNMRFPSIKPRRRSTEPFRSEVYQSHRDGTTLDRLSHTKGVSSSTIERWCHEFMRREVKEKISYSCPRILGVDEHFFTHKMGFATTFCDLEHHRIYDVVLGRSSDSLRGYLHQLEGRKRVRVVCIDLSGGYRSLVKRWFPNAKIVADRFHVIRLINQHFMNFWKEQDEVGRRNIRLLRLMRRHRKNLNPKQRIKLERYLNHHPALQSVYNFKQKLCKLMNRKAVRKEHIPGLIKTFLQYIDQLQKSPLYRLGATLKSWMEEIALMWRFSRNNGITEGFHNKMELISRKAYGFKNFENYRLRVRSLCA